MYRFFGTLVVLTTLLLSLSGCGAKEASSTPTKELTLQELAAKKSYAAGEINKLISTDPSVTAENGMRLMLNIQNVRRFESIITPSGTQVDNVIVVENVTPIGLIKPYIENKSSFELFDKLGVGDADIQVSFEQGTENALFILKPTKPVSEYQYLSIGGIDPDRNDGHFFVLFPINDYRE